MKNLLFVLLVIVAACSPQKRDETSANSQLVTAFFAAFNAHDWEKMASYYTDPALFLDPTLGKDYVNQTHRETVTKYSGLQSYFPNIHDEVVHLHTAGDCVIAEFVSTGTGADGSRLRLPICTVFTIANGKIVRDATYFDNSK